MGVLPLEFVEGESAETLGLTGRETYDIEGMSSDIRPRQKVLVRVTNDEGSMKTFYAVVRIDSQVEVNYYRNGGILQTVIRNLLGEGQ